MNNTTGLSRNEEVYKAAGIPAYNTVVIVVNK